MTIASFSYLKVVVKWNRLGWVFYSTGKDLKLFSYLSLAARELSGAARELSGVNL